MQVRQDRKFRSESCAPACVRLSDSRVTTSAEIPKLFHSVIGVTGTLDTLSKPEFDVLQNMYGIRKYTYMPSVYGSSQLEWVEDSKKYVMIEPDVAFYGAIRQEVDLRKQNDRAILVFFETSAKLMEFYLSTEMADIKDSGIDANRTCDILSFFY
jgi:hypothetical protein